MSSIGLIVRKAHAILCKDLGTETKKGAELPTLTRLERYIHMCLPHPHHVERYWLHGDKRGSIDRFHSRYRSPYLPRNDSWWNYNRKQLKTKPLILRARHRKAIHEAIQETCRIRKWSLLAFHIRTNHVHTVVSTTNRKPELVLGAFKANATRQLRENGLWSYAFSPWADRGSKRKLWNERSMAAAIDYVLYGQGDELPDFDE